MDKEFVKDFNPTIIELNENYRSSIAVLQAAQQLILDASQQIEHTVKQGVFELYKVLPIRLFFQNLTHLQYRHGSSKKKFLGFY
jgi:superfamily I DNA/RNA helicase